MKIECTIKRKTHNPHTDKTVHGTVIELGKRRQHRYEFKPIDKDDPDSPHVCEVEDADHIGQLLAVASSFRLYDKDRVEVVDDDKDEEEEGGQEGDDKEEGGGDPGVKPYEKYSRGELRTAIKDRTGKPAANGASNDAMIKALKRLDANGG